jgi:hypothetical protein
MRIASVMVVCLLASSAKAADETDPRAGAWDRSVALQAAGDLPGAEQVMIRAWGKQPDNYWAGLRLAYLALLQARQDEARERYQALRDMPEAEGDSDVVRGHASAIAAMGWWLGRQGLATDARSAFRRALGIDPENQSALQGLESIPPPPVAAPEIWTGVTGQSVGSSRYLGWAAYAQAPVRISDRYVLRAAGRYVSSLSSLGRSGRGASGSGGGTWSLDEEYLTLARDGRVLGVEVVAARSSTSDRSAILGGGGRLRVGATWGFVLDTALLHASGLATNLQARPMGFVWLGQRLGLQAGARLTSDDRGDSVSASAGASLVGGSLALHLLGHLGSERWAFGVVGPSIMSFDVAAAYGGATTLIWSAAKDVRLGLLAEVEGLRQANTAGYYWSVSAGVQVGLGTW